MMKDELISYNINKGNIKIDLNSEIDLYKIPIKTLTNSKLSDFNGQLIYQILTEMISDSEILNNNIYKNKYNQRHEDNIIKDRDTHKRSYSNNGIYKYINNIKEFKIEKINFQIKYDTKMGEDLAVIGSINELGNWELHRALKMGWNDGNIWKGVLYLGYNDIFDFE